MKKILVLGSALAISMSAFAAQPIGEIATIQWEPPTTRMDGQPLSIQEISHYNLECADIVNTIPGNTQSGTYTLNRSDMLPGYGVFDCTLSTVDKDGLESEPSDPVTVSWEPAPPSKPTNVIFLAPN